MSAGVDSRVGALVGACERDLGDAAEWITPRGYPDGLALCIIDAIYSTGARHVTVENIFERYGIYRAAQGGDIAEDGAPELLGTFHELGDASEWANTIGNRRPTSSTPGAPLKAQAVKDAASRLVDLGIPTAADLREVADSDALDAVKKSWLTVPGQRSGVTWAYVLMLAGVSGVKVDRSIVRYVARILDVSVDEVAVATASELIRDVAQVKGWDPEYTEQAIWRFASKRPVRQPAVPVAAD
ncbi:heme peroxidase [Williamsia sp.]|uniref:heme peroxidase n=1 Tax=Williamsia sp. TaxID=1872085 RepID=UPI002F939DB2